MYILSECIQKNGDITKLLFTLQQPQHTQCHEAMIVVSVHTPTKPMYLFITSAHTYRKAIPIYQGQYTTYTCSSAHTCTVCLLWYPYCAKPEF